MGGVGVGWGRGVVRGEFKSIYWFQIFTLGSNNVKKSKRSFGFHRGSLTQ